MIKRKAPPPDWGPFAPGRAGGVSVSWVFLLLLHPTCVAHPRKTALVSGCAPRSLGHSVFSSEPRVRSQPSPVHLGPGTTREEPWTSAQYWSLLSWTALFLPVLAESWACRAGSDPSPLGGLLGRKQGSLKECSSTDSTLSIFWVVCTSYLFFLGISESFQTWRQNLNPGVACKYCWEREKWYQGGTVWKDILGSR